MTRRVMPPLSRYFTHAAAISSWHACKCLYTQLLLPPAKPRCSRCAPNSGCRPDYLCVAWRSDTHLEW